MEEVIKVACVCGEKLEGLVGLEHNNKEILSCDNCKRRIVLVILDD
jgi:hypothetical protein